MAAFSSSGRAPCAFPSAIVMEARRSPSRRVSRSAQACSVIRAVRRQKRAHASAQFGPHLTTEEGATTDKYELNNTNMKFGVYFFFFLRSVRFLPSCTTGVTFFCYQKSYVSNLHGTEQTATNLSRYGKNGSEPLWYGENVEEPSRYGANGNKVPRYGGNGVVAPRYGMVWTGMKYEQYARTNVLCCS